MFSFTKNGRYGDLYSGELSFKCGSNTYGDVPDAIMFVKYLDGGSPDIPISAGLEIKKDRPLGHMHLLELPAGNCEFISYTGVTADMTTRTTLNSKPFSIKFEVKEGRTTYVGNFNLDWSTTGFKFSYNDFLKEILRF